ncbi:TlpA disulfide reductase family protein [Barnesiella sp. An55]|uniref:TlpA disulfide reductase family protein n=1 Tax=Barnesiella sp. An55 TaxID=1965646 RepID=UPI0013022341|nr:TlpA disulfide reductase family protein [Barnesiella sp. An55]
MNKVCYWILPLMLLAGCQRSADTSYVIDGHVNNVNADGNIVYLSHSNGDELVNLDSAIVDGGHFSFRGEQEVPIMAYLRFNRSLDSLAVPVLFVLENGLIEATLDTLFSTVTGTEQNMAFETYKVETHRLDSLRRSLHDRYLKLVADSQMNADLESSMYRQYGRYDAEEVDRAYRFIRKNRNSPAALWLLESMQSRFSEVQLEQLMSELGGRNKNAQVLTDIAQRLRSADKIEPGSPYADVQLVDMWGRNTALSGYVGYARYVVVGFWQSSSAPSCRAMVKMGELYREYGYRGATFLSISLDSDANLWREQVQALKLPAHQCIAADPDEVESRYALAAVPGFILINPDGTMHARNLTVEQLESRLKELLPYRMRRDTVNRVEVKPDSLM